MLRKVGMEDKAEAYPDQLSGGQKAACRDRACTVHDTGYHAL